MSEEEISFKIDWTPEQKKAFKDITGFTELDDDYIKIEQLLKVVEKQQQDIENYKKFKKDIVNRIMIWDKKELPDNGVIIEGVDILISEVSRLEDIEDKKIEVAVKFIEEKRDKYWEKKIKEKIKELEKEEDKVKMMPFEVVEETHRRVEQQTDILKEVLKEN